MTTLRMPVLGFAATPGTSGNVWFEPFDIAATNDIWRGLVVRFKDSGTRISLHGRVSVPRSYVGSPKIVIRWTSATTTGSVVWDLEYRAVAADDVESLDQATAQESLTVTDVAPSAAFNLLEVTISLTAGNLAANDVLEFILYRDGTDVADTHAADALLMDLLFEWADA